jgi:AcrR family transcriptional regulator
MSPTTSAAPRERLLNTALRLFYEEGIGRVGVDRIVSEAPVTRATFYRHFRGKDELVAACLQMFDAMRRAQAETLAASGTAPADQLRSVAGGIGDELCTPGFRGCVFINAAAEYPDPDSAPRRAIDEHRRWFAEYLQTLLTGAGHAHPDRAARHLVMLRDGAMVAGSLADPATARETLVTGVDRLLEVSGID